MWFIIILASDGVSALAPQLPSPEVIRIDAFIFPPLRRLCVFFLQHPLYPLEFLFGDDWLVLPFHDDAVKLPVVLRRFRLCLVDDVLRPHLVVANRTSCVHVWFPFIIGALSVFILLLIIDRQIPIRRIPCFPSNKYILWIS